MIRGNVFFEVEKIEQLALINRLTTHHDLRPSLKGSDDGIMIRQYPRGLFQQHRSKGDVAGFSGHFCFTPESGHPCAFMSTRPRLVRAGSPVRSDGRPRIAAWPAWQARRSRRE